MSIEYEVRENAIKTVVKEFNEWYKEFNKRDPDCEFKLALSMAFIAGVSRGISMVENKVEEKSWEPIQ